MSTRRSVPESAYQPEMTRQRIYEFLGQRAFGFFRKVIPSSSTQYLHDEPNEPRSRDVARKLDIRFAGSLSLTDLATRLRRVGRRKGDASDATPEIAALQEKYDIGAIDWAVIDASGTPEQTRKQCQTKIAHL